jgi:hypothetical protein
MAHFDGYRVISGPVTVVKLTEKQAVISEPYVDNTACPEIRRARDTARGAANYRNRVPRSELYASEHEAREALRADIGRAYDAATANARRLFTILGSL